ncbi:CD4-2 molecule, tandem duplicate 2 [Centropristis striata]|uniref:CD4-2 molecule, tandem duplicate 2 n=1 Tax=Centropristis striata TaxID=184440 RepID=UPI0027E1EFA5|nr:CD4-2 molecule, tandem duplicate 2 [Centropristis striata]
MTDELIYIKHFRVLGAFSAAAKVFVTKPRERVLLECGVSDFRTSLVWNREGALIFNVAGRTGTSRRGIGDIVSRSRIIQTTKLQISPVKLEDAGNFICEADRKRHEHTLLVVSVSASPSTEIQQGSEATLLCQVKGLKPGSTVKWKRPGGTDSGSETVQLKPVAQSDAGVWTCLVSHDGVSHSERLEIKVQEPRPETPAPPPTQGSKNTPKQPCKNCSVPRDTDTPALMLLGLSWWIWVAVGVGVLVMVLLIILVIVLCKRIKRKKRKLRMMKNGRIPLKPKKYCECDHPAAAAKPRQGRRREKPSALPLPPLLME